jgi:deoxyribodipyrimidine photo-lyase
LVLDTRIMWFRRDLRISDNPALAAACAASGDGDVRVVPLFVLDPRLVGASTMSPARLAYLADALADLDRGLHERDARLILREGDPREVVPALVEEVQAGAVHWAHDVTPFATRRDQAVAAVLAERDIAVHTHGGVMIHDPGTVTSADGNPFKVYTPFRRAWERLPLPDEATAPATIPLRGDVRGDDLPTRRSLGVEGDVPAHLPQGGEGPAAERADAFLDEHADRYRDRRNFPAQPGTSRLSADLHYGCVSPRALYRRLDRRRSGQEAFGQELVWRDFYGHVMAAWPEVRRVEFNPDLRGLPYRNDPDALAAWREGRTGYPFVDAAMRQLLAEGWMHNRARMTVASFLSKDLLADWREGEAHFLRHLVDADVASNNGGWQWAAGTGTDAQPYFRIFNPVTQGQRFDPDGGYVRRWVPELAAVPDRWLQHPWDMPDDVARESGVVLGKDYPEPIVDHAQARREALAFFRRE